MSQENVEAVTAGFELWNIAVGDLDSARRRRALEAMAAAYRADAVVDFSRTTFDYPATKSPEGMLKWMEEAVRWASVKATLAGNLKGPPPRFIRVARGRYSVPSPQREQPGSG